MISILEPRISRCLVVEWPAMTQYDGVDAKNYALLGMLESTTCFNLESSSTPGSSQKGESDHE